MSVYTQPWINLSDVLTVLWTSAPYVKFKFETLTGENLGEYITNEKGTIELDVQKDLNILKRKW